MALTTRWIFIDDTDSSITYRGPWFQSSEDVGNGEVSGRIYGGSQRGTNETASLTYTFSGTDIRVYGTSAVTGVEAGDPDPRWACSVDDTVVSTNLPSQQPQNNRLLCGPSASLNDGQHVLTLLAQSRGAPFWFDFFMINPSVSSARSIANPAVFYAFSDPTIQYPTGQWRNIDQGGGILTQEAGATMLMTFNGTKVTWFGRMLQGFPSGSSTATYSIDGGSPVTFTINGINLGGTTRFQQVFFETDTLPMGKHNISVRYLGASSPLVLEYLIIQNGDVVFSGNDIPPPVIGDQDQSNSTTTNHDNHKSTSHTGVIVGGVVGGVALLVLLVIIFFLLRKLKQRRVAKQLMNIDDDGPSSHVYPMAEATPFIQQPHPSRPISMAYTNTNTATTPAVSPSPSAVTSFSMQQGSRPLSGQTSNNALMQPQRMSTQTFGGVGAGVNDGFDPKRSSQALAQLYDPSVGNQFAAGSSSGAGSSTGYAGGASTSSSGPPPQPPSGSSVDSAREEKRRLQYHYENNNNPTVLAPPPGPYGSSSAAMTFSSGGLPVDGQEPTLVHHQDSGVRLGATGQQFVDVPPSYTPQ